MKRERGVSSVLLKLGAGALCLYLAAFLGLVQPARVEQRERTAGFIDDAETFARIWKAFKPGEAVPEIDFKTNLVPFCSQQTILQPPLHR